MKRLLLILPTILLLSCGNEAAEEYTETNTEPAEEMNYVPHAEDEYGMTHEQYEELAAQGRTPRRGQLVDGEWQNGEDELDYVLTLKQVGDGAYPSYSIEAMPNKQEESVWFYLNAEDYKGTSINELMENIGQPVRIVYYIRTQNHMNSVVVDGEKSREMNLQNRGEEKSLTGKWVAEAVSQGDLPDNIYIETANELRVAFPAFITEEDVALNGKEVTVNYMTDEDMVVSYIELLNN